MNDTPDRRAHERIPIHWLRLFAMCLVLAVPIVGGTLARVNEHQRNAADILRERAGLATGQVAADLLAAVQRYRLALRATGAPAATRAQRATIEASLAELGRPEHIADADSGPRASVGALWAHWRAVERATSDVARARATMALGDTLLAIIVDIEDTSRLTYDPTVEAVNMVDALMARVPGQTERLEQSAELLMLARDDAHSRAASLEAEKLSGRARELRAMGNDDFDGAEYAVTPLAAVLHDARVAADRTADRLSAAIDRRIAQAGTGVSDRAERELRRASIAAGRELSTVSTKALMKSFDRRIAGEHVASVETIVFGSLVLVASIASVAFLWQAMRRRDRIDLDLARERAAILETTLARRNAERALRMTEQQFRAVFDSSHVGIAIMEPGSPRLDANAALHAMFDGDLTALVSTTTAIVAELARDGRDAERIEHRFDRHEERPLWVELSLTLVGSDAEDSKATIVLVHDITEHKMLHAQLDHETLHDTLTGLPNRVHFVRRLATVLRQAGNDFAVAFIDLDHFKSVNDTLGHHVGDRVLRLASQRLSRSIRPSDFVARLHGDEFAVLFTDLGCGTDDTELNALIERLTANLVLTIDTRATPIVVTASIGIARAASGYRDADEVLRDADAAMYRSKVAGRGRATLFNPNDCATTPLA